MRDVIERANNLFGVLFFLGLTLVVLAVLAGIAIAIGFFMSEIFLMPYTNGI